MKQKTIYELYSSYNGEKSVLEYFDTKELAEQYLDECIENPNYYYIDEKTIYKLDGEWYWPPTIFDEDIVMGKTWDKWGWASGERLK